MKLSKLPILVLATVALMGSSCSSDGYDYESKAYGTLSFTMAANNELDAGNLTRADEKTTTIAEALGGTSTFDVATFLSAKGGDFIITILDSNETEVYSGKLSDYDANTPFAYGSYTVKAVYDPTAVGFYGENGGEPSFESEEVAFTVNSDKTTVEIPVALSNSILRVDYTEMFKKYYSVCESKVKSTGNDTEVTFSYNETRGAFFNAAKATITYTLTPSQAQGSNASAITKTVESTLAAKTCHTLTFDVTNVGGAEKLTITLDDDTITEVEIDDIDLNNDQYIVDNSTENSASGNN